MVARTGGDLPDPINTETEYMGKVPMPNTVGDRGPLERDLDVTEVKRLGLLTGDEEDVYAPRETGFMGGVDSRYPDPDNDGYRLPPEYRSDDYLS